MLNRQVKTTLTLALIELALRWERRHLADESGYHKRYEGQGTTPPEACGFLFLDSTAGVLDYFLFLSDPGTDVDIFEFLSCP